MKTHLARTVDGKPSLFWLAYRVSQRSYYDGESPTDHEDLIDADTDANVLRERVNKHQALAQVIRMERGKKMEIPPFALESNEVFGNGGGCDYRARVVIREAPRVTTMECTPCNGTGREPNPDPAKAANQYFNVTCEACKGAGTV